MRLGIWGVVIATMGLAIGCAEEVGAPEDMVEETGAAPMFLVIPKDEAPEEGDGQYALRPPSPAGFYIAIHERALTERWFLSAFMKDYFPDPYGPYSLGTRVVSFKVQNGKLFMFDVDDRRHLSNLHDPEVIVDAYPIIHDSVATGRIRHADEYVVFDPAEGLNRFGLVGDDYDAAYSKLDIDLTYVDQVNPVADGISYELTFTGYMDNAEYAVDSALEPNPYRASGTIGIGLRQYTEGEGYVARDLPMGSRFFSSDPYTVNGTGEVRERAIRWNVGPDKPPIEYVISRELAEIQEDPMFGGADLVGAVIASVEAWNEAFGFRAVTARLAEEGESPADDSLNFIVIDTDQTKSYAFANWRTNPNTGEIRGASVYMGGFWMDPNWIESVTPEPAMDPGPGRDADPSDDADELAANPRLLSWGDLTPERLCHYDRSEAEALRDETLTTTTTLSEYLEKYLIGFIIHEVGHTLGLRHNFKASMTPEVASSVMDYLVDDDAEELVLPGTYDTAAIRYLYGLSEEFPPQAFCTDGNICRYGPCDPNCIQFDEGEVPLRTYAIARFKSAVNRAITRGLSRSFDSSTDPLLNFLRYGTAEESLEAWNAIYEVIRNADLATASEARQAGVDAVAERLFWRLYIAGGPSSSLEQPAYPPASKAVVDALRAELNESLIDTADVRSFATRRTTVDVLAEMQTIEAYQLLLAARTEIEAQITAATDLTRQQQLRDLAARIDSVTQPYFR